MNDETIVEEMLARCAKSWMESDPPQYLREDVQLRFGHGTPSGRELPEPPIRSNDADGWRRWLEDAESEYIIEPDEARKIEKAIAGDAATMTEDEREALLNGFFQKMKQAWIEWLARVVGEFPIDPESVEQFAELKREAGAMPDREEAEALLNESAQSRVESHLAADPL